jgi:hypothetical protein
MKTKSHAARNSVIAIALLIIVVVGFWVWWNRPTHYVSNLVNGLLTINGGSYQYYQLSVLSVISIISSQFRLVHQTFKFRALSQHLEEAKMTSRFMYWTSRILSTGRTDTLQARIIMVVN